MVKCCAKEDVGFEVGTTLAITALEQKLSPLLLPLLILPICHFISYDNQIQVIIIYEY